jgi:mannose/fructose-specific phosphotransferase system component IIA
MNREPIGVAVVGHGTTASQMLAAARIIAGNEALADVLAIDAGPGETPTLSTTICDAIAQADRGRGVLVLVDLLGASPCQCAQREAAGHPLLVVAGVNLAMLLKVTGIDRSATELEDLARLCADAGHRAIAITQGRGDT